MDHIKVKELRKMPANRHIELLQARYHIFGDWLLWIEFKNITVADAIEHILQWRVATGTPRALRWLIQFED